MIFLPKNLLLLTLPVATTLVVFVTNSKQDPIIPTPKESLAQKIRPKSSPHPLAKRIQWKNYLQNRPQLQALEDNLLPLSGRLPLEQFEALEPEMQLRIAQFAQQRSNSPLPPFSMCWAPGVAPEVIAAFHAVEDSEPIGDDPGTPQPATQFSENERWGRTATFNSFLELIEQGKPTTLTWSFVADGTSIFGFNGEPTSDSDLIEFLDGVYGESPSQGPETTMYLQSGDVWKYLADGSDQGTSWREIDFDDSSWPSGPSQLGYGDGDEATNVGYIDADPNTTGIQKNPTTYFRSTINIEDPTIFENFTLNYLFDDGIVIYVNGEEVARVNLASNPSFDDYTSGSDGDNATRSLTLASSVFRAGINTIAAEVHQTNSRSSDVSFDLTLTGNPPGGGRGDDLTSRSWFAIFQQVFDNISAHTGITYVYEPNDDGANMTQNNLPSGSLGVRGDIRIGGHYIDGDSGSNTLAYNFSPSGGDMVIDTSNASFYGDLSRDSLNLRNVVEHEHGHGLALDHICPINQTKLMEPFISRRFRGLQLDDIFSLNRLYGDYFEKQNNQRNNDTPNNAARIPISPNSVYQRDYLSIDDNTDVDYFLLEGVAPGDLITFRIHPVATPDGFLEGPQNADGSCSAGSQYDFTRIHDLGIAILSADGQTVLSEASAAFIGQSEEIVSFEASQGGNYYLEVTGDSANNCQLYSLEVALTTPTPYQQWASSLSLPEDQAGPNQDPDNDGILNIQEYYFGLSPLVANDHLKMTSGPAQTEDHFSFTFSRNPEAIVDRVTYEMSSTLSDWSEFVPTADQITILPAGDLEEVTISIPKNQNQQYVRIGIYFTE